MYQLKRKRNYHITNQRVPSPSKKFQINVECTQAFCIESWKTGKQDNFKEGVRAMRFSLNSVSVRSHDCTKDLRLVYNRFINEGAMAMRMLKRKI
jgi:uncharacterized protein (DUF2147 family)